MTANLRMLVCLCLGAGPLLAACEDPSPDFTGDDTGADADGDSDSDSDADSDADADGDSDGDGDADTETGPIEQDCSACPGVGNTLDNMACAIDLCDKTVLTAQEYKSPTNADTKNTYAAVQRFGAATNDLDPKLNGSYALMASGPATGTAHSVGKGGAGQVDPFGKTPAGKPDTITKTYDVMEWRLHLKAPAGAHGFEVLYVFFSEEYDDYVGTSFNDKFYIFIEASSTNGGKRTVINFTECRNPTKYKDFVCDGATMSYCDDGKSYCYIAINTALSECCWYGACPKGKWTTNIAGTGFSCAASQLTDGPTKGSSTGWLKTSWNVEPEEDFDVIFHIHDTNDAIYDSEVILDSFQFVGKADPGTTPVE